MSKFFQENQHFSHQHSISKKEPEKETASGIARSDEQSLLSRIVSVRFLSYISIYSIWMPAVYSKRVNLNILLDNLVHSSYCIPSSSRSSPFLNYYIRKKLCKARPLRCYASGSIAEMPRCSTGVEKTICVRVRPKRCSWLINWSSSCVVWKQTSTSME